MLSYYEELLQKKGITLKHEFVVARRLLKPPTDRRVFSNEERRNSSPHFNEEGLRICKLCSLPKEPQCFSPNRAAIDGRDGRCKPCKAIQVRIYKLKKMTLVQPQVLSVL